ncbi:hypothetical protein NXY56_002813 [Leishmania guyanensis]|uniref:Uncharacterized protein n=1 Tax=Leishmania guyanensis TaxID=5670 RepID=A0A1E1IW69_LEIGU|nr:hypothetical protein, unknown function [Leishmania guyanensis]
MIAVLYPFLITARGLSDAMYISMLFEIFPFNRDPVVFLTKVTQDLSSPILACLSRTLFKYSIMNFMYFLCASALIVLPGKGGVLHYIVLHIMSDFNAAL